MAPKKTPRKKTKQDHKKHRHKNTTTTTTTGGSLQQCQSSMGPSLFTMVGYMILAWLNFLETFAPGSPQKCSYAIFDIRTTPYYKILQPYHNSTTYHKTLQPHYLLQCTIAFYSMLPPYCSVLQSIAMPQYCSVLHSATTVRLHTTTVLQCTHPHYELLVSPCYELWFRTTKDYNRTCTTGCYCILEPYHSVLQQYYLL